MLYKIVDEKDPKKFQLKVNECLEKGWKLQGGVTTSEFRASDGRKYCQALVKDS